MTPSSPARSAPPRDPRSLYFRTLPEGWEQDRRTLAQAQRERMLDAMARAVATRGYAKVTVADVVALAGVSRSTFYEHFGDKEECFLAAYEAGCTAIMAEVAGALRGSGSTDWHERVDLGIERYLDVLAANAELTRALLVDVLGAGPRAVEQRRIVFSGFVDLFRPSPHGTLPSDVAMRRVPEALLRGLVGGISELVQEHIVTHGAESLPELHETLLDLAFSIVEVGNRRAGAAG